MTELERERDYYRALSNDLGAQLVRTRDEQTRAMRALIRARTATSLIRKIYRLDHVNLPTEGLARTFLETAVTTLTVERAALFRHEARQGGFVPLYAIGFTAPASGILHGIEVTDGFRCINSNTPADTFSEAVRTAIGARYFVWCYDASSGLALLFGNDVEDSYLHPPFENSDSELMEAVLDVFVNILERKRAEQQLLHDAFHDSLTGLPNRALFIEHLDQAIRRARRASGYLFSVLFLDMDRFKFVNDSLGHVAGDQLLKAFGQRLVQSTRPGDVVARLGGDEFAILADDLNAVDDAVRLAERIHHELQAPFHINNQSVFTSASIGIAKSAERYQSAEELLRDADIAMYSAKQLGGASHRLFDSDMHVVMISRLQLETDLRQALEQRQLRLYFQPVVELANGRLAGFEALLRWKHPVRGLTLPKDFISIAEETGLIVPIGRWILEEVARLLRAWGTAGREPPLRVSTNLSDREFIQPDMTRVLLERIENASLDPRCLEIELTERMLMHYAKLQSDTLSELRLRGVSIAIDDFGTGYSSLSRLQKLPIDKLKIDSSFIHEMETNEANAEMVRTIIAMAHNLGMQVVAEGVETAEQCRRLRELGCEYAQGHYFSRPVAADKVPALIARDDWLTRPAGATLG
ncbi:MAG TPA: EAL domain-containing protein [Gammaproteobacteria bacterium]|nr:EAL domain-containing protein [Gammaproteobacteria bacterium]